MSEENKAVALRYLEEAINQRNLDVLDDIFSPKFVDHTAVPGQAPGIEGLKQFFAMMRAGFPDFSASVEDLFAEGDRVAIRFTFRGTHQGEFMDISPPANR